MGSPGSGKDDSSYLVQGGCGHRGKGPSRPRTAGPVAGEAMTPGSEALQHPASPHLAGRPWSTLKKAQSPPRQVKTA